jgi:hypothetical protein
MGLIRKQAGLDLKAKIENWISEYMGSYFEYTIDDDYRIKSKGDHHSWLLIYKLSSSEIEIPDYVSFSLEKRISISTWQVDVESIVNTLNKYSHLLNNLEYMGMINHRSYSYREGIEIVKTGNKFKRI